MKLWTHYHIPESVAQALQHLAQYDGQARVVAGGTDLLLDIQQGNHPPVSALVDITKIQEINSIQKIDNYIYVGAGVTHTAIVKSPILAGQATCLVESCGVVGGPQVRNVATLGGNVAHALPAADGTLSLRALNAQAEVATFAEGQVTLTWHDLIDLFAGPGQSKVDSTRQLLTRFRFKLSGQHEASAFKRIMRPQGVALPVLGCAVWVKLSDHHFAEVRIAVGPVGPIPSRATSTEAALVGLPAAETSILRAAELAQHELHPRTSKYRATAEYRAEMISLLVRRALTLAVYRAQTGDVIPEGVGA